MGVVGFELALPNVDRMAGYRLSGGMEAMGAQNRAWATVSTGRCLTLVVAGSLPR
jgi:hypothetical protein